MTEASRGRVTITLGRSGQVVKRDETVSNADYSDSLPRAGSKRSVRDRLGSNLDGSLLHGNGANNKRQRRNTDLSASGADDVRITKDDLRFKLIQKNVFRQSRSDDDQKVMDLREKLSRTVKAPASGIDTRHPMPESKETGILGRVPLTRSADDLPQMDSSRNSYSPWTLDHLRRRSPDRILGTSRGLSPPRSVEGIQRRPLCRTFDDVRVVPYMSKDVLDAPRPVTTAPFMTRSALPTASAKPALPGPSILGQLPPPGSVLQKSSYTSDEQQTVDGLLHSLGLGKYAILFKAEEVDMTALKQMGENDLKELGIPMGPRKKILLALLPHSRRQP